MMATNEPKREPIAASPSASGPAGAIFEGQVGAHYLLTMLAEADPRGRPGVLVERVELQRAGEGHPLDDVIVRGVTNTGAPAVLEVQVKRTITFAPGDTVFKDVVTQLAAAYSKLDPTHDRHQFAVATERTSFKITGPYQDVLRWAREVGSASTFAERINRKKVGNDDMRSFVATVRAHLAAANCANDDETVWQVLRRFQILTFDYDAPGSQSVELALERARHVLALDDVGRASALWKVLTETAIRVAASGGDLDRDRLINQLAEADNFRLLGTRRNRLPRETLSEAALLAAADLRRSIAGATLARSARLDAVRAARDGGRYIEILGGPGVGKSGLLGLLVQQVLAEGRAVVLTPERTVAGGWLALKSTLGVDGSPQAFLSDLASDGGAVLFVDSLDFFGDAGKRATVVDLVRSAAEVPGFQVIATARTGFDKEEPNWLPADVLKKLGRAPPVVVEELGAEEIEELKAAAPALRALLADDHPARAIARNLFRLSRLLDVQGSADELRSEVDLLERWWSTADGAPEGRRDRARLLSDLSDAVLGGAEHVETRAAPAAIDALIASESLRELGLDRVGFRHDVLREWGMAVRLYDDLSRLDRLPLTRPASTSLARGVELGARLALERAHDGTPWLHFLDRVSRAGAHASWRRFALLAILRSELAFHLLERASAPLFGGGGALLRELIRTAIAVESRPLVEMLAEAGTDVPSIPAEIYGPANGSWARLVRWLLLRRADLPLQALPDVVELFQSLSLSMFVSDPLTPTMATALADWLDEIEAARDHHPLAKDQPRFAAVFGHHGLFKLAEDVRHAFAFMAARVPGRVRAYLQSVLKRRNPNQTIKDIMKFRGAFAQAAPGELAELTLVGLIAKPDDDERHYHRPRRRDIFTHLDTDFLPSSPAQGPFLDLLNAAPEHGLSLVRRLVDHAVAGMSDGEPGDDGLTLALPSGPRFFPWQYTYYWSRNAQGCYAVESALMALEAWSHARIERGDAPDEVIADILGPDGSPAAFVMVAVDVLISHWPKTLGAIVPFLGSPELLVLDRTRQVHDSMPDTDLLGWGSVGPKEPRGPVSLASLEERLSRQIPLEYLLGHFTHIEGADLDGLRRLLDAASERLGSPQPDDTFAEPRLMARYALNLTDRANWQPQNGGVAYVSPPEETQHVADLQAKRAPQTADFGIDAAIQNALENAERSGPELAEQALLYAKRLEDTEEPEDTIGSRTNAVVSAAMIVARDGVDALYDEYEQWVRDVFASAFDGTDRDMARGMRDGIRFNPIAIATLGLIHVWRRRRSVADRDLLLELAGRESAEAAQGFGAGLDVLREIDPRLIPAALRCALSAQIHPDARWDDGEEKKAAGQARYRERVGRAIEAERAWLNGDAGLPDWPQFPAPVLHVREGLRIGGSRKVDRPRVAERPLDEVYAQTAALWVRQLTRDSDRQPAEWIAAFVDAFADWTARANGAGSEPRAEIDRRLDEWNNIFFRLLARSLTGRDLEQAAANVAKAIAVPDESFFDIAESLVPALDELYFNDLGLSLEAALQLRGLIADRLMDSAGWRRERDKAELSVEMRIGPAIGVMFFTHYNAFSAAKCYLLSKGVDRVEPFFPQLTRLIEEGPVPFTGLLTMSLLEVSRKPEHAAFFLNSALNWLRRQPDNVLLWVDGGLGARLAKWLETATGADPSLRSADHPLRAQLDDVLARLVQVGVAEAHRVEMLLASPIR
ncbi:hypothetical protein [Xanthobacter sp. ZOL 2024]